MPSNHLVLCCALLLLPSIFPNIRVFSNESDLCIRWPKYWNFGFGISPSNEDSGLISFRIDWFDFLAFVQHHISKHQFLTLNLLYGSTLTSIHDYWKDHNFDYMDQNQIACILCSQRWRSSIWSAKRRPAVDCGSDYELLIAKFRLKLKNVGETTRPFRYDLNQIPCDYTVEIMNRCKGLNLVDRLHEELWMKVHNVV